MEREDKESAAIPEEKAGEPSAILPMTPESKQLAAVIATAVATAMAGKSASPDSSSSMVRYSAGVSLASRTRSIISIVRNLKLHLVTLPGANLASNELLLKLCKAYFALRQLTDQAGVSLLIGLEEKTEKNVITKEEALLKLEAGEEIGSYGQFDIFTREESIAAQRIFAKRLQEWVITQAAATGGLEGVLAKIGREALPPERIDSMEDPSQYVLVAIFNELQHHGGPIALSTARTVLVTRFESLTLEERLPLEPRPAGGFPLAEA